MENLQLDELAVARLTGEEFAYTDLADLRVKAIAYYRQSLQGHPAHSAMLGEIRMERGFANADDEQDIVFGSKGRKEIANKSAQVNKLLAVKHLPDVIARSNFINDSESTEEKHAGERFYYLHAAIDSPQGRQYIITTIRQARDNQLYYHDHNIYSLNEYNDVVKKTTCFEAKKKAPRMKPSVLDFKPSPESPQMLSANSSIPQKQEKAILTEAALFGAAFRLPKIERGLCNGAVSFEALLRGRGAYPRPVGADGHTEI